MNTDTNAIKGSEIQTYLQDANVNQNPRHLFLHCNISAL